MLMGSSPNPKCLFMFILHACLLLSISSTKESSALVQRPGRGLIAATCNRTTNVNLCIKTLQSDPRSFKSDVKGLAKISLEKSLTKANQTLNYCEDLYKDTQTQDPVLNRLYGSCIVELRSAAECYLPGALICLESNEYGDSKFNADEVVKRADVVIGESIHTKLPVLGKSLMVRDLCLIASGIVSTLQ